MVVFPVESAGATIPAVSRRARRMREAPGRAGDVIEAGLLEVARTLVEMGDFQTTPIREIARRAGISRQGFYFYYQSKEELLAQLVTETLESGQPWRQTLYHDNPVEPVSAMRGVIFSSVVMWRQHFGILRAAVEIGPRSPVLFAHWVASVEETADFLSDLVTSATKLEQLRDPDAARRMVVALVWMISQNCYMHIAQGSDETDLVFGERLGDIYIRAIGVE